MSATTDIRVDGITAGDQRLKLNNQIFTTFLEEECEVFGFTLHVQDVGDVRQFCLLGPDSPGEYIIEIPREELAYMDTSQRGAQAVATDAILFTLDRGRHHSGGRDRILELTDGKFTLNQFIRRHKLRRNLSGAEWLPALEDVISSTVGG